MFLEFIEDQLKKCEDKIKCEDYDGSITNARSLIESVLVALDYSITGGKIKYDGDLMKLYKTVQKHLNLSPARDDISNSLKSVLSGLISIISGIGSIRNKMSDSHVRTYKPAKHHAVLIVNALRTLVRFGTWHGHSFHLT